MLIYWPGDEREKVSANFTAGEFFPRKHKYGPVLLDPDLVKKLQKLRKLLGQSIRITSGYRPAKYNKKIGGAPKSKHMLGMAADMWTGGMDMTTFAKHAYKCGFRRIGISNGFIHVDVYPGEAYWQYGKRGISTFEKPANW